MFTFASTHWIVFFSWFSCRFCFTHSFCLCHLLAFDFHSDFSFFLLFSFLLGLIPSLYSFPFFHCWIEWRQSDAFLYCLLSSLLSIFAWKPKNKTEYLPVKEVTNPQQTNSTQAQTMSQIRSTTNYSIHPSFLLQYSSPHHHHSFLIHTGFTSEIPRAISLLHSTTVAGMSMTSTVAQGA